MSVVLLATAAAGSRGAATSVTGEGGVTQLGITTTSLPNATEDSAYSQTVAATGGAEPYSWSIVSGSLGDLSINSSTGAITGTPTTDTDLSFTVRVTDNNSDTADQALSITVDAAGGATPFYSVNFDDYADRAAMLADPQLSGWLPNTSGADISLTTGLSGTPWGGTKALRSTYFGGQGGETSAGLDVTIPNAGTLQLREMWFELYFRFQSTWTTDGPNAGNQDHKTFLLFDNAETGSQRWEAQLGNGGSLLVGQYIAGTGDTSGDATQFWDQSWYRARFHCKNGTDPASAGTAVWVADYGGGTLTRTWPGGLDATFSGNYFNKLAVFRNLNKGSTNDQWCEAADIKFYSSDPGWGI